VLKFFRLTGKSNMNMFDWINSNDWIVYPPEFFELTASDVREFSMGLINQNLVNHALGWTKHMFNDDWTNPKKILHSLRPLMTVLHYIESGVFETNIQTLVKQEGLEKYATLILTLIDMKKRRTNTNKVVKIHSIRAYEELEALIKENRHKIPEHPDPEYGVKEMVTDIRLKTLSHFHNLE